MIPINNNVASKTDKYSVLWQCYSYVSISGGRDGAGETSEQEMLSNVRTQRDRYCYNRTCTSPLLWCFFFYEAESHLA